MAFKHIFLKDYVDGGMNTYAVYRQTHVYDHIDYIIEQVTECSDHQDGMILFVGVSVYFDHVTHFPFVLL